MERPSKLAKVEICSTTETQNAPSEYETTEKDLPLLSNVDDFRVHHYVMKLTPNFNTKIIKGVLILFIEWLDTQKLAESKSFPKLILDACCLNIQQVRSLKTVEEYSAKQALTEHSKQGIRKNFHVSSNIDWFAPVNGREKPLQFSVDKWALNIYGWSQSSLPSVIRIDYETREDSPSIHWRPCDGNNYHLDSRKCVYSPAPPINNRGLFPCQEPPCALATWEAFIQVENVYLPLLTSDEPGEILEVEENIATHYFYTSIPLPMSTFAMIIGKFSLQTTLISNEMACEMNSFKVQDTNISTNPCSNHLSYPCSFGDPKESASQVIPVRLFVMEKDCIPLLHMDKLSKFLLCCLKTCYETLGPHPFARLDLIIMPKCFPHMGLANPFMTFLSPSNFTGNEEPLFVGRIPHEICHSWFGLLIGALDMTEEWLSEGFATYFEDIVFRKTFQCYFPHKTDAEVEKEYNLRICLRFITLQNELRNTEQELHVLGSKYGDSQTAKNGLVPIKQFMHVHYYKGYLLLWHMAFLVGQHRFLQFMRDYVYKYHGQLTTSDIFLNCYAETFKEDLRSIENSVSIKKLKEDWLESNTLPAPYQTLDLLKADVEFSDIPLFSPATDALQRIKSIFLLLKAGKVRIEDLEGLSCSELLILLEHVLSLSEEKRCLKQCSHELFTSTIIFQPEKQNPEVIHRWCEIIILCKDKPRLSIVKQFLYDNIAMGVYLYGELMISEKLSFQRAAKKVYHELEDMYDTATKRLLKEMLF
ncbi:unnamed protein product [Orchesella dallaii]|uniref:Peptidase M1 leukotriene A4 hydrolase/aminopeptidase C-terminal domain-containing protein n=1 Tax=Orchesella dallaii TaxID=48710 RepID=A0ABP1SA18_9HEXA